MTERARSMTTVLAALALVGAVLGVQLANGGGRFEPLKAADPCVARTVTTQAHGIEGLTERLVLLGIDGAACRLEVSREALTLRLAQGTPATDVEIEALREGLRGAVLRMAEEGSLPPASELADEALDSADLNVIVETLLRAVPDAVVDAALKTDDVLTRTIADLDVRALLDDLSDQDRLEDQVESAVIDAVTASLIDRISGLG